MDLDALPTPQTTLVILLGASTWPRWPELEAAEAFANSAKGFKSYLLDPHIFSLPPENMLDLFDVEQSADDIDEAIHHFLRTRITEMQQRGQATRDVLLYFTGHAGFVGGSLDYYLAIRRTRKNNPEVSGLRILSLARTVKEHTRHLRRFLILDCCYAASAFGAFQNASLTEAAIVQTTDAFRGPPPSVEPQRRHMPKKGTTLLCSSSRSKPSLMGAHYTEFSGALLHALRTGSTSEPQPLSFHMLAHLVRDYLDEIGSDAPRPEIHSPDQGEGDIAGISFFPNPAVVKQQTTKLPKATDSREQSKTINISYSYAPEDAVYAHELQKHLNLLKVRNNMGMQHESGTRPISFLCIAAPVDESLLAQWETHLLPLQQAGLLLFWSERHLAAGADRIAELARRLDQADGVILLLSADFFSDSTCLTLMRKALLRKSVDGMFLVPLLVRPVVWQESEVGTFAALPSNGIAITTWESPDEGWRQAVLGLKRQLGFPVHRSFSSAHKEVAAERGHVLRLLRRTYQTLLDGSLQGIAWIELGLSERPEAVRNAVHLLQRLPDRTERQLPGGTTILSAYDQAAEELLILGSPGAGKSTLLLDLAMDLIARAEVEESHPIPIIVPLSSWAGKRLPLGEWLVEQLFWIYGVPRKLGELWTEQGQVLPLLDGLDEMEESARPLCITAINTYHIERATPLVVCSRQAEYEVAATRERLLLQNAVVVQALTKEQADVVIRTSPALSGLHDALSKNPALRELTTTPLMLSVMMLAYRGIVIDHLPREQDQLEEQIWTDYVERMVREKGAERQSKQDIPVKCYPLEQTRNWLCFLAGQMWQRNLTVFEVESLQTDWLSQWPHMYRGYHWSLGLVVGLIGTLVFMLIFALIFTPTGILVVALVEAVVFALAGVLVGEAVEAPDTTVLVERSEGLQSKQLVERHTVPAVASLPRSLKNRWVNVLDDPIGALFIMGIFMVIFALAGALACVFARGLIFALAGALIGALVGALIGILVFVLGAPLRHYLLRFWLWQAGGFPFRASSFLEDACARHLLRRLGENYQFVHQLLLDHLAMVHEVAPTKKNFSRRRSAKWPF